MIAFADMMRKQIVMPAHLMNDNEHMENNKRNLFKDFSSVAQATGTYTGQVGTSQPAAAIIISRRHCVAGVGSICCLEHLLPGFGRFRKAQSPASN